MITIEDVRDWVGSTPDDTAVTAAIDRFVDTEHQAERAALVILRRRRADLYDDRSQAVDGDTSWGAVDKANLMALDAAIDRLEDVVDPPPEVDAVVTVSPVLGRPDFRGRPDYAIGGRYRYRGR